jgi:hypothetical protein
MSRVAENPVVGEQKLPPSEPVSSPVLTGFWLRVSWLWQDPLPPVVPVLKELGVL